MKSSWKILHPVFFAVLLVFPPAAHAQLSRRPVTFGTCVGVLSANSFYKVSDGWYPLFGFELHTDLRPWLAYDLDLIFVSAQNLYGTTATPRFFTAGLAFGLPIRSVKLAYKVGYGVAFTQPGAATLFAHGLLFTWVPARRWELRAELRQWVPNDWFERLPLTEHYSSFSFSLGGGLRF